MSSHLFFNGSEGESFILCDTPGIGDTRHIDSSHIKTKVASLKKMAYTDE